MCVCVSPCLDLGVCVRGCTCVRRAGSGSNFVAISQIFYTCLVFPFYVMFFFFVFSYVMQVNEGSVSVAFYFVGNSNNDKSLSIHVFFFFYHLGVIFIFSYFNATEIASALKSLVFFFA